MKNCITHIKINKVNYIVFGLILLLITKEFFPYTNDLLDTSAGILIAVIVWLLNDHSKQKNTMFIEKYKFYSELLNSIDDLKDGSQANANNFIMCYHRSWVFASTEVINKIHNLMNAIDSTHRINADAAVQELAIAIRNDMQLPAVEGKFRIIVPTNLGN